MEEEQSPILGWGCVVNRRPLIIVTWAGEGVPLGLMSFPHAFADQPAIVLLFASSFTDADKAKWRAHLIHRHRAFNLLHHIVAFGSDATEAGFLRNAGLNAMQVNANCFLNETVFKPLPDTAMEFEAVYNARPSPDKRHELAVEVKGLGLICFRKKGGQTGTGFQDESSAWRQRLPHATFLNWTTDDDCVYLTGSQVNEVYARSRVGLILSACEGTNRASMEYMMAGLPVVSTRSVGARDYFFDPEYCCIVEDNPGDIAQAVSALSRRNIPRHYISDKTMRRVERERERFCEICEQLAADQMPLAPSFRNDFKQLIKTNDNGLFRWTSFAKLLGNWQVVPLGQG